MTTWTEFFPFWSPKYLNTFSILIVDKNRHFWTIYLPLLVHVLVERPQRGATATLHTGLSDTVRVFSISSSKNKWKGCTMYIGLENIIILYGCKWCHNFYVEIWGPVFLRLQEFLKENINIVASVINQHYFKADFYVCK